jgi:Caspase domain
MAGKAAVLVGINRYAGFIRHRGHFVQLQGHRLYGCLNDVNSISDLLIQKFGFVEGNIQELTDKCATQSAILDALNDMVNSAAPGDRLLFYFSGHGSLYRREPSGGDPKRKATVFEILCPYDMNWDREIFISKEDLKGIVDRLPDGTAIEMVLDACCAGGMRDVGRQLYELIQMSLLGGSADSSLMGRSRFLVPPDDVVSRIVSARGDTATPRIMSTLGSDGPKRCIIWAGSNDHQISQEFIPSHGREHGAFTYFFSEVLKAMPTAQRATVLQDVRERLKGRFRQVPGLFPQVPVIAQNCFLQPGAFA